MRPLALLLVLLATPLAAQPTLDIPPFQASADRIIEAALADSTAYVRLAEMADAYGHRLSGSQALEDAIDWMLAKMEADGLDHVRGEEVMVPHWVRGEESATLIEPRREPLAMLGMGNSVGTPEGGITAEVLVVGSFDELAVRADEVAGKIVLYNVPFTTYGQTVPYRTRGASEAARYGAVASLVRSVGPVSLQTPHTGTLVYDDELPRIPHAALTIEGAELLQRMQDRGERVVVTLDMEAEMLPDARSRNVVAELVGRESPEEIVVIGGHIDSWDVGQGVVDDAGGVVASWEAVRLLKDARAPAAPYDPRRRVDERGERAARRQGVPRRAHGRTRRPHPRRRDRRRRVRARQLRRHGERLGVRDAGSAERPPRACRRGD